MKNLITILIFLFLSGIVWGQIQNPGFEEGTLHWTGDSHLSISEETSIVHNGSKSLNCTFDSQTQSQCDLRNDFVDGITEGNSYDLTAWFYDNDPAGRARLTMSWYDSADNLISTSYGSNYTSDQAAWQQLSMTATAPTGAVKVKVGARFYDVSSNWDGDCTIYADDFDGTPPLPVELTTFTALASGNVVELHWKTATEVNNYGFYVERASESLAATNSGESKNCETIDFVNGHGNSSSPKEYSYVDETIGGSGKYFYRLKQVDVDGSYEYSPVVEVYVGAPEKFELSQNYPNPFNPTTTITYSIPTLPASSPLAKGRTEVGFVTLKVYDILGREVATLVNQHQSTGRYTVKFNASGLNSGIYFYKLQAGDFTQVRRMMLVK